MNRATPKKYANALNEINEYLRAVSQIDYKHSDIRLICLRVKVTHLLFDHAVKLGYFDLTGERPISNMQYFQPMHGRKVSISITEYQKGLKKIAKTEKPQSIQLAIPTPPPTPPKRTPVAVSNQKTTFYELRLFGIPIYSIKSTK